ncbi:MAG: hypothetical protein JJ896_16260 [Rhodothermales bacterium]|nr:hypothetical protein [Rhodothermales bacterium]MBO6781210.1 hypothetical protein [Rhodothermales bacterium]
MKALIAAVALILPVVAAQAQTTFTGTLSSSDPARSGGERYDQHTFEVVGSRKVTVRMESDAFDTYLVVRSPSGMETVNDDFDGQRVSQVELWATEPGTWVVWASQYSSEGEGAYTLLIDKGAEAQVEVRQGRLDYADTVALKGEFFDTHAWDSASDGQFIFELVSFGFDGYLVVTSPTGEIWRNDDAGSTQLSRIGPVTGTGKWRIDVTSVSAGESGAYDLRLIVVPQVD